MDAAALAPDYSRLFGSHRLSDCTLVLQEDPELGETGGCKRRQAQELLAHAVVLFGASPWFEAKLEPRWAEQADAAAETAPAAETSPDAAGSGSVCNKPPAKRARQVAADAAALSDQATGSAAARPHTVELAVPAGQLAVGELLVRGIYCRQLQLAGTRQEQLLQLLVLADRYKVAKVLAAAASALAAIPTEQLEWATVTAAYQLPPGCAGAACCKPLIAAAAAKLQAELGDLELVWNDKSGKRARLEGLPHAALKQLLADPATCVASEATVWYTIERWQKAQQEAGVPVSDAQLAELLALLRLPQCPALFLCTLLAGSELAAKAFSAGELGLAAAISGGSYEAAVALADLRGVKHPALAKFPAWSLGKRPASSMASMVIGWRPPLSELQAAAEAWQASKKLQRVYGRIFAWCDQRLEMSVRVASSKLDPNKLQLGLFLHVLGLAEGGARRATYELNAAAAAGGVGIRTGPTTDMHISRISTRGRPNFFALRPAVSGWPSCQAALHAAGLVHADGCLHLRCEVTRVQ